jgi:preprotein translocase subunit YajC
MAISEIAIQSLAVLAVLTTAYLFLIRPQLKRITEHDLLLSSLNLGDRVVTGGGLIGKIVKLEGTNIVELELSKSVRVQAIRSSIESKFRE